MLRTQGFSEQDAYNAAGEALSSSYEEWNDIVARVSQWSPQAVVFIETCCKPAVLGVLYWSFETERYFGKGKATARSTRQIPAVSL